MNDLDSWTTKMADKPLPGGIAAAAVSAAMGAALVAKAGRVTLNRVRSDTGPGLHVQVIQETVDLASAQRAELLRLASADEQAFQAVLSRQRQGAAAAVLTQTWRAATDSSLRVTKACQVLLDRLSPLDEACSPIVLADLEIGRWLLETGVKSGLLAAESNQQLADRRT